MHDLRMRLKITMTAAEKNHLWACSFFLYWLGERWKGAMQGISIIASV